MKLLYFILPLQLSSAVVKSQVYVGGTLYKYTYAEDGKGINLTQLGIDVTLTHEGKNFEFTYTDLKEVKRTVKFLYWSDGSLIKACNKYQYEYSVTGHLACAEFNNMPDGIQKRFEFFSSEPKHYIGCN